MRCSFLLQGFPRQSEFSVPCSSSLNGPSSLRCVDHSQTFRGTCPLFSIFHFCFVWISEIELGSWRAFVETASSKKMTGSGPPLLSASFSLVEHCGVGTHVERRLSGSWGKNAICNGNSHSPLPLREHPVGKGTIFTFQSQLKASQVTQAGQKCLEREGPPLCSPHPWPTARDQAVATQLCSAGTPIHLCWELLLPHITSQILPSYNGFSPAAKHLMGCSSSCILFSAIFALCRLLSVVLYCPLQRRAAFSLLSPSFTEFSNLFFAAHLSPWRLLLAIDFCIHVFLNYTLSPAIL